MMSDDPIDKDKDKHDTAISEQEESDHSAEREQYWQTQLNDDRKLSRRFKEAFDELYDYTRVLTEKQL